MALCGHLASDALAALPVDPADVLEWQDGPIAAVVRCAVCDGAGLLELLEAGEAGTLRVYALSGIAREAVALWRHNAVRGSCDLARRERELEALVASAGPAARVVARDASSGAVLRSAPWPAGRAAPEGAWQERMAAREDRGWFAALGLR